MKFLTDSEIIKFNENLQNTCTFCTGVQNLDRITVSPIYSKQTGHPDISIGYYNIRNSVGVYGSNIAIDDIDIEYKYSFSIVEKRSDLFFLILNKLFKEPIGTQILSKEWSVKEIVVKQEDVLSIDKTSHNFINRDFIKYTYNLKMKLSKVMVYVSYLEDAINYFQKIYGYEEDGTEVCLMKYKIGDIVSLIEDKSINLLVLDYDYYKTNDIYYIRYVLSEMLHNDGSAIIRYKTPIILNENLITYSRNNRIDDILN